MGDVPHAASIVWTSIFLDIMCVKQIKKFNGRTNENNMLFSLLVTVRFTAQLGLRA